MSGMQVLSEGGALWAARSRPAWVVYPLSVELWLVCPFNQANSVWLCMGGAGCVLIAVPYSADPTPCVYLWCINSALPCCAVIRRKLYCKGVCRLPVFDGLGTVFDLEL